MKMFFALVFSATMFAQTTTKTESRRFYSPDAKVMLFQNEFGIMPVIETEIQGDAAILVVLYKKWVDMTGAKCCTEEKREDGKALLTLSKTVTCPGAPGALAGCDYIEGIKLSDVSFVRLKVVKFMIEIDIKTEVKMNAAR